MKYTVNSLIEWKINDKKDVVERILWINDQWIYVIDINKNNVPYLIKREDLEEALLNGIADIKEDALYSIFLKDEDIPEKHKRIRDKAWNMIKDIVNKEPQIFESTFRRRNIKQIASEYNVSELSVLNYLKRYWKRGKVPNALLPDYYRCGGRGKEKRAGDVKRGRPRKHKDIFGEGVNVTEEIKKIFKTAVNRFYYTTAKNSLVLTYELMRKEYFNEGYKTVDGVKIPIIKPQSEIPSFGQFRYWFEKERNIKREITSRYSNKKFLKQYRAIVGNADDGIIQPGTFEIDCQIGDLYLVSRYNRNWIIGRPAIYAVIDKFSRMICGIYVGLENGSYIGAMMALMNTAMDKVKFCKQYGIEIKDEDWPVHHLPETLIADRGELEGVNINNLINMLNVKVKLAPPYRAELKALIERFFGLNNDRIKPFVPSRIDLDGRERGDKDYRVDAKLDLYQFTQIMIKAVLYHNNHYILNNYKRDQQMIEDEVRCIPRELFNWGIANRGGTLRSVPEDVVKLALMPSDTATITAKGIRYKDMYYASASMLKNGTFVNARIKTKKVKISYDPRDMNQIYVHGDNPNEYEKCYLIDSNSRYRDKTIEEIEYLLNIEKMQKEKMKDLESQAKTQLIAEIENIVQQAEEDFNREIGSRDSSYKRLKNIRENRKAEKIMNRLKERFELDNNKENYYNNDEVEEVNIEENGSLDLLLKKQKEGLESVY
ncbi:Mu transposase, C-terminal [Caloranaerobacter azorensis DSM 13643]|uniref:Mu transposase, C-terminal n=1 Tax=Caloranaerobacter azorensis DSM 13643 TaxID=1121264 RepID=A0A1M5W6Z0_9FIRM|nr:Mu transposase C-terminal domain-containing protein [Caloranaerobacter azorensis]SHH83257.1 Mu transposase, C-terminal [Caloranaerobacter azorensis DSM 13643]